MLMIASVDVEEEDLEAMIRLKLARFFARI